MKSWSQRKYMKNQNKTKSNKAGVAIFISLVIGIILMLLLNWLLKELILKEYSPDYFVCVKLPFSVFYIFYPIFFLFVFSVAIYFYPGKKLTNKKYICFCSAVLCIALAITIALCGNVWSFNKDKISYNTLFEKDKIVYSTDDIETAELQVDVEFTRLKTTNLVYDLKMSDGKEIKLDAYDSFRTDDDKIIEFDKAISQKRKAVGQFERFENASDEFNDYFCSLF